MAALQDSYPDLSKKQLKILHYKLEHKDELFYCIVPGCDKTFIYQREKQMHYRRSHLKQRIHQCQHCEKTFSCPDRLRMHKDQDHPEKSKKQLNFCCSYEGCLARFTSNYSLVLHLRSKHKVPRKRGAPKMCPICQQPKLNLKMHMRTVHCKEADRLPCEICGKSFSAKHLLKQHQDRSHLGKSNNKKVVCTICGKEFSDNCLRQHIRAVHKKIRHQCSQCERSYVSPSDLRSHIKSAHQGQKFRCRICQMEFGRPTDRNRHEKKNHPTQDNE